MNGAMLAGLEVSSSGILERADGQRLAFVAAAEIQSIQLGRGFRAERMLLQIAFAVTLLAVGLYALTPLIAELLRSEPAMTAARGRLGYAGIFLVAIGGAALVSALLRGPHLRIQTERGTRKLHFHGPRTPEQMDEFVADARGVLGIG